MFYEINASQLNRSWWFNDITSQEINIIICWSFKRLRSVSFGVMWLNWWLVDTSTQDPSISVAGFSLDQTAGSSGSTRSLKNVWSSALQCLEKRSDPPRDSAAGLWSSVTLSPERRSLHHWLWFQNRWRTYTENSNGYAWLSLISTVLLHYEIRNDSNWCITYSGYNIYKITGFCDAKKNMFFPALM